LETKAAIQECHPEAEVQVFEVNTADPTNYGDIIKGITPHLHYIVEKFSSARFYISAASGTSHSGSGQRFLEAT